VHTPVETIEQETDPTLTLAPDAPPCRADEGDLVLLDDAPVGHQNGPETMSIPLRISR